MIILNILVVLVLFALFFYLLSVVVASFCIYNATLTRKNKDKWGRQVSIITDRTLRMDGIGMEWQREHDEYKKDVHIVRDGINLYGEYYDMGYDRAVIVLSGRTESLRYAYYFAKPYSDSGFNVLAVDSRCHGHSDGRYITVGFEESKDALAWSKLLSDEYGVKTILYHGICIGAASGMLAITAHDCPKEVKGLVAEGMFPRFRESMRNNLIERKRLMFPVLQLVMLHFRLHTGHSMRKGPANYITEMNKPILMLHSKKDKYSTYDNAVKMFESCPSKHKTLVSYEEGDHSMLRITDTEKYDSAITEFINQNFNTQ